MRLFLLLFSLVIAAFASAAPKDLPENVKSLCVLVRSTVGGYQSPSGTATGTGFFIDSDLVLTCNHLLVIPFEYGTVPASNVSVETKRGHFVEARIVARDIEHDLALLQLKESNPDETFRIPEFTLDRGGKVTIIGNFPEAIRVVRGELLTRSLMEGFAMSSAKVRSGFSGGPIIDETGCVQGILSQRDDANNSIFVRSDVIRKLLRTYCKNSGRTLQCLGEREIPTVPSKAESAVETVEKRETDRPVLPMDEIVVAIPVRRATADYSRR